MHSLHHRIGWKNVQQNGKLLLCNTAFLNILFNLKSIMKIKSERLWEMSFTAVRGSSFLCSCADNVLIAL